MGQWTQAAEDWFHRQMAAIRDTPGSALKTPSTWDNHLKYANKALQAFREASDEAAIQFLRHGPFNTQ
jgi:hypothetical protein